MAWVMSVLGALLALGGGYALWNGSGYIRLDWGQAETVAGTVALSAGILAIGLAAVLFALRDLARASARAAITGTDLETAAPQASVPGRLGGKLATVGLPRAERIEPTPAPPAPVPDRPVPGADIPDTGRDLDEPFTDSHALSAADVPPGAEPPLPAPPPIAEAPTVVGRYEANGASYVLFSDGTIEVETEGGTHRFESMDHLRDHIGRQDAG